MVGQGKSYNQESMIFFLWKCAHPWITVDVTCGCGYAHPGIVIDVTCGCGLK